MVRAKLHLLAHALCKDRQYAFVSLCCKPEYEVYECATLFDGQIRSRDQSHVSLFAHQIRSHDWSCELICPSNKLACRMREHIDFCYKRRAIHQTHVRETPCAHSAARYKPPMCETQTQRIQTRVTCIAIACHFTFERVRLLAMASHLFCTQ